MRFFASFLFVFVSTLFSCQSQFGSCSKKVQDLHVNQKDTLVIPLKSKTLVFSPHKLENYKLYDPFLNLYIVDALDLNYPFKFNKYLKNRQLAAVNDEKVVCGKIVQEQIGLDQLAKFSQTINKPSVVLNGCCEFVGIATSKGIIQKRYLQRFLSGKNSYADVGIRLKKQKQLIVVDQVNPFVDTPFHKGDIIKTIQKKKATSLRFVKEMILFAPVGSKIRFEIQRGTKQLSFLAKVYKRLGGGFLDDSFLKTLGVFVDNDLVVKRSSFSSLHVNDKIFQIRKKRVKSIEDLQNALSDINSSFRIGLNRNGLDMFVKIDIQEK